MSNLYLKRLAVNQAASLLEMSPRNTSISERVGARVSKKPRKEGPPVEFDLAENLDSE
jgi:hypothetical protein